MFLLISFITSKKEMGLSKNYIMSTSLKDYLGIKNLKSWWVVEIGFWNSAKSWNLWRMLQPTFRRFRRQSTVRGRKYRPNYLWFIYEKSFNLFLEIKFQKKYRNTFLNILYLKNQIESKIIVILSWFWKPMYAINWRLWRHGISL